MKIGPVGDGEAGFREESGGEPEAGEKIIGEIPVTDSFSISGGAEPGAVGVKRPGNKEEQARIERLRAIRRRIVRGFYDRPRIKRLIAEKLAADPDFLEGTEDKRSEETE